VSQVEGHSIVRVLCKVYISLIHPLLICDLLRR
jgi:hypothetical protein